jgi:hypothetical protein
MLEKWQTTLQHSWSLAWLLFGGEKVVMGKRKEGVFIKSIN